MLSLGAVAFLNPWLLAALASLPLLWFLLRAIPPSPRRLGFPGVRLLLGLEDPERTPDRTPWWLLLLRCLIAAAAIIAFAQPILNPRARLAGSGPVLLLMDGGWASAADWEARRARALEVLDQADRSGRPVVLAVLADLPPEGAALAQRPAGEWRGEIEALLPKPWAPRRAAFAARLSALPGPLPFAETVWLTDGLVHDGDGGLAERLAAAGPLAVVGPEALALGLRAPELVDGQLGATVIRAEPGVASVHGLTAWGTLDEGGVRRFGQAEARFEAAETEARAVFDLPLELRNRVERLVLAGPETAASVVLADDGVRRRRAALVSGGSENTDQQLVSDLHYLRTALEGRAETVEGVLADVLARNPDVLFLADVGRFTDAESAQLTEWVESGGLLVRFAGPRLARGTDALGGAIGSEDPLLPVRLRAGGRSVGGAMAWAQPQRVRPFVAPSPFAGLSVADEVQVTRQILAQLGPDLPQRTWAALADGTPLVTAAPLGAGRVVLFHVTANAEWSSLPLSGLFVEMVGRLLQIAGGTGGVTDDAALAGATARPLALIDGFGRIADAVSTAGVPVERLREPAGPEAPPGIYAVGESVVAYNLLRAGDTLAPAPPPPFGAARETLGGSGETPLAPWLLGLAVLLLALDTVATLVLSGRLSLRPPRRAATASVMALAIGAAVAGGDVRAQAVDDATALRATLDTVLAYVITGDETVDRLSAAGLDGLGRVLTARTAIEPALPVGVNIERDEIAFFPVLYWPITPRQPTPSDAAIARLNAFMRTGGMIVFDTRDRHLEVGGATTQNAEALRRIAGRLDLPALEPVPQDHVLTRTFFLLDAFPGRYAGGRVWVEATPPVDPAATPDEATELRNANDGVTPVVVGNADWAAAWAVDESGNHLAPVSGGDAWRQREMAYRFGVNLVMYALTGNYKSDQVHVPALLERLGQ